MNNDIKLNKETLEAAKRGDKEALMANLSESEKKQLMSALNDKEGLKSLLNSDTARRLMKILGGNKNG